MTNSHRQAFVERSRRPTMNQTKKHPPTPEGIGIFNMGFQYFHYLRLVRAD